jgi:hypothetical protein
MRRGKVAAHFEIDEIVFFQRRHPGVDRRISGPRRANATLRAMQLVAGIRGIYRSFYPDGT